MSYTDYEYSTENSRPDELYDFEYKGTGQHYRTTSSAYPITFDGNLYTPSPVSSGDLQRSSELGKNNLTVSLSRSDPFFQRYITGSLSYETELTVYVLQEDDAVGTFQQKWKGVVSDVALQKNKIEVTCSSISSGAARPILHRMYQALCPHALFDYHCGADRSVFTRSGVITAASGYALTSPTFATETDDWFAGGDVTINGERKTIKAHTGDTIILLDPFYGSLLGLTFDATAGCPHTLAACDTKFTNAVNYGGCPWIPTSDDLTGGKSFTY